LNFNTSHRFRVLLYVILSFCMTGLMPTETTIAADGPKALTESGYFRQAVEYGDRITREAYLKVGKKSPAWDATVLAFLDAVVQYDACRTFSPGRVHSGPSLEKLREMALAVHHTDCDDPLVFTLCTRVLHQQEDSAENAKTASQVLDDMQQRHYPPIQMAKAARSLNRAAQADIVRMLGNSIVDAICAKEFPGMDRRFVLQDIRPILAHTPGIQGQVLAQLRSRKDADPWLAHAIMGEMEIGYANKTWPKLRPSGNDKPSWEVARRHLLEAWKLHPDYPEPAVQMMRLASAGGGAPEDTVQLWFKRASAAQFDWPEAYAEMRQYLMSNNDMDALYVFGVECLKSGRYDTDVPWQFLLVLNDIQQAQANDECFKRPGVYNNVSEFFRKNSEDYQGKDMDFFNSQEAYFDYRAGHFDDARKALEKITIHTDNEIFAQHSIEPGLAFSRIYALTGPLRADTQAMEEAATAGRTVEAARACRNLLASVDKNDKAWRYLHGRVVVMEIEARCAAGEEVSIQPTPDLAGWIAVHGDWSVDEHGGLVGRLDPKNFSPKDIRGPILLCQAKIGTHFELTGHAELLEPKDASNGFGAVIAYDYPGNYWSCFFVPPSRFWGNEATVTCSLHHNPHKRRAKVTLSEDFRIQVYNGRVATAVGAELQREYTPFVVDLDHDPPSNDSPFGVGASRGMFDGPLVVVRFTGLKVKKMTASPAEATVPLPE
jgi:hypothetical protein